MADCAFMLAAHLQSPSTRSAEEMSYWTKDLHVGYFPDSSPNVDVGEGADSGQTRT
jgi:hypothetical protein